MEQEGKPSTYVLLNRIWQEGDVITLKIHVIPVPEIISVSTDPADWLVPIEGTTTAFRTSGAVHRLGLSSVHCTRFTISDIQCTDKWGGIRLIDLSFWQTRRECDGETAQVQQGLYGRRMAVMVRAGQRRTRRLGRAYFRYRAPVPESRPSGRSRGSETRRPQSVYLPAGIDAGVPFPCPRHHAALRTDLV